MDWLDTMCSGDQYLNGLVITQLPDCLAWKAWQKIDFDHEDVAAYFGDMIRAQRSACQTISPITQNIRLTIESDQFTILAIELTPAFAIIFIFDPRIALGMARLSIKRFCQVILENLPKDDVVERSRGERLVEFVKRYAPDPHTIMMRVSLQAKIPAAALEKPATLSNEQVDKLEQAVKSILGISNIHL